MRIFLLTAAIVVSGQSVSAMPVCERLSSLYQSIQVRAGDTVRTIAERHNTTIDELYRLNDLDKSPIRIGRTLVVPISQNPTRENPPQRISPPTQYFSRTAEPLPSSFNQPREDLTQLQRQYGTQRPRFSSNTSEPQMVGSAPPPVRPYNEVWESPPVRANIYTVRPGDTLSQIARRHSITMDAIQRANNLANPSQIRVDQRLIIPQASRMPPPVIVPPAPSPSTFYPDTPPRLRITEAVFEKNGQVLAPAPPQCSCSR